MTSKKERYSTESAVLLEACMAGGGLLELEGYIRRHSNLPGPRGNLELAHAFADAVAAAAGPASGKLWGLLCALAAVPPDEAPINSPGELIPFCGALGLGALAAADNKFRAAAFGRLRSLANDPRWRIREAVAQGLQRLLAASFGEAMSELETWIGDKNWLEMRAVAAGVAEPDLLKDPGTAETALKLHRRILGELKNALENRAEDYLTLRKALGYSLSVVVCALPVRGFGYLHELAVSGDKDMHWILKNNLKKARLVRDFPEKTAALLDRLD